MNDVVRDVAIKRICRKDAPALRTLRRSYFLTGISDRSPSKLSIQSPFVCSTFVDKHELICLPVTQTSNPVVSCFLIAFCSQFVALFISAIAVIGISEPKVRTYHFSAPVDSFEDSGQPQFRDDDIIFIPNEPCNLIEVCAWPFIQICLQILVDLREQKPAIGILAHLSRNAGRIPQPFPL